jgi:hypothetical protein
VSQRSDQEIFNAWPFIIVKAMSFQGKLRMTEVDRAPTQSQATALCEHYQRNPGNAPAENIVFFNVEAGATIMGRTFI